MLNVSSRWRAWCGLLARLVVGGVFLGAGLSKVGDLAGSVRAVDAYELLPYDGATVVGSVLPFVEVVIGVLLLAGLATRLVAAVGGVLLLAFTAGIVSAWARGLSIDCGCFGSGGALPAGQSPRYAGEVARDVALLAASVLLVMWPSTPWSVDRLLAGDSHSEADADADAGTDGDSEARTDATII
jgi:uncharacterized membrane protein YphA (DoxX/SURF4 family)